MNASTWIDGREDRIAEAVGIKPHAVRVAAGRGKLPARWYVPLREAGLSPPESLFRWAKPETAE